jgi:hypothetical protein
MANVRSAEIDESGKSRDCRASVGYWPILFSQNA